MKAVIDSIRNLFKFHKLKFLSVIVFTIIFAAVIFPYDDLSDIVTAKITEASQGTWYIQFDQMSLGFFPPGVRTENVLIESQALPSLNANSLEIMPWIAGALALKTGVHVNAGGLFKGNVSLDFKEGDKLKSGERERHIALQADGINLPQLSEFLRSGDILSLGFQGTLGADTTLSIDPLFDRQPAGHVALKVAGFTLPSQSMNTQMGPVQTPTLKLGNLAMQAKMNDGRLEVESMTFGGPNEDLSGKIQGDLHMAFRRDAVGVRPQVGGFDFKVDLSVKKAFLDSSSKSGAGLIFVFINKFRQDTPQGARFAFRMKSSGGMAPPEFLPYQ